MKITQVKVRLFEMPMPRPFHPTWQFLPTTSARIHMVEVHTDEGIVWIGSGGVPVRWEVAGLFLAGQDPFDMDRHVAQLRSMAFFVGRPWPVEVALWDVIGQATGQPIYRLLGGGEGDGALRRLLAGGAAGRLRLRRPGGAALPPDHATPGRRRAEPRPGGDTDVPREGLPGRVPAGLLLHRRHHHGAQDRGDG